MKYLPLLWAGLWRKPIRTVLTLLSITVAFMLFGVLNGVVSGFDYAASKMSDMRLRVINRANMLEAMPISYEARIARIPGVRIVSHLSVLVGYYQEPRNNVSAVGLTLGPFAKMFTEMKVPAEQIEALHNTRDGAVVGGELAKRFNWKIGDRVTLHSLNQVQADGSSEWTFQIVGLVNAGEHDEKVFANELYFNYEYLDEARAVGKGTVHQYALTIDDASHASEISQAIDREFANSSAETSTMNEREYLVAQLRQIGNVRLFVYYIIGAVLFTLLFLAGNTMAQSVRDRRTGTRRSEDARLLRHDRVAAGRRGIVRAVSHRRGARPDDRGGVVSDHLRCAADRRADPSARHRMGGRVRNRHRARGAECIVSGAARAASDDRRSIGRTLI